jgi:hypothetical protein
MKLEIVTDTGPLVVETDARDRRAFEVIGRPAIGLPRDAAIGDVPRLAPESYILWIAWHAATREGYTTDSFPEFESHCVEVKDLGDEAAEIPDPTKRAR